MTAERAHRYHIVIRTLPGATFIERVGTKKECLEYANRAPKKYLKLCKMVPVMKWDKEGKRK